MAGAVVLEIQGAASNFTFTVQGSYWPRHELVYRENTNPPQAIGMREEWEFRGCRLHTADGTVGSVYTQWAAFVARIKSRSAHPTYARLVIPGGATLLTLGPPTYEAFKIEAVDGEQDALVPEASWRSVAVCTIRVSALIKNADVNGIVGFEQEVINRYPDSRHMLEWRTRITTAEGVSAVAKAQAFAAITASALGGNYLYETNGPYGVETVAVDADEVNGRVPTVCDAISRVTSYGITFSNVAPGNSPSEVSYSVTVKTSSEGVVTTTHATARGPNGAEFVASMAPGSFSESEIQGDTALGFYSGIWSDKREKEKDTKTKWAISVTLSGGQRAIDYEPAASGYPPLEFVGAFQALMAVVEVNQERVTKDEPTMLLPGPPGAPWRFDAASSSEGEPFIAEESSSGKHTWSRQSRLVFRAPVAPDRPILVAMRAAGEVRSYITDPNNAALAVGP